MYVKLPGWFKVPTPLGSYNPDWAIVVEREDGIKRLYYVVETKSTPLTEALRSAEKGKLECGEKHFGALTRAENPAHFMTAQTVKDVLLHNSQNTVSYTHLCV